MIQYSFDNAPSYRMPYKMRLNYRPANQQNKTAYEQVSVTPHFLLPIFFGFVRILALLWSVAKQAHTGS